MKRMLACLCFAAFCTCACETSFANDEVFIFKDFSYGTTKEELRKKTKAPDCGKSTDGYDVLCLKNYDFLGYKWTTYFAFENNKLVLISLVGSADYNKTVAVIRSLSETFALVSMQSVSDNFDFVATAKARGISVASDALNKFEQLATLQGKVTYIFLEGESIKNMLYTSANLTEIMQEAPISLREIDLSISPGINEARMAIRFVVPIKVQHDAIKNSPDVKEKF